MFYRESTTLERAAPHGAAQGRRQAEFLLEKQSQKPFGSGFKARSRSVAGSAVHRASCQRTAAVLVWLPSRRRKHNAPVSTQCPRNALLLVSPVAGLSPERGRCCRLSRLHRGESCTRISSHQKSNRANCNRAWGGRGKSDNFSFLHAHPSLLLIRYATFHVGKNGYCAFLRNTLSYGFGMEQQLIFVTCPRYSRNFTN